MICPDCDGKKSHMVFVCGGPGAGVGAMPCHLCEGTGEVGPEKMDWRARGEAMRNDRLSRGLSQREEAARLGIHPVELSKMEFGQLEPIDYDKERKRLKELTEGG